MYERFSNNDCRILLVYFFFQAEDGIRDLTVTGVQTCALPISMIIFNSAAFKYAPAIIAISKPPTALNKDTGFVRNVSNLRSEERRVGKECRYRWSPYQ